MLNIPPKPIIRETAFSNEAMNVRIPFKGSAERVEDTNNTRDKVFRFV